MRKLLLTLFIIAFGTQLFAYNKLNTSVEMMYKDVGHKLNHKVEKYEQTIIDTTYLYYYKQFNGKWDKETWNIAVDKCVELCNNKAAVTASKAGNFGEKFLQALIVTGEDAWKGLNKWVDEKSKEYEKRK